MDPAAHILAPLLLTEAIRPPALTGATYARWRERAAIVLAALAPDVDGVLRWIRPDLFARYHRLATHTIWGLFLISLFCAVMAARWPVRWLFPFLRPKGALPVQEPTFRRLWAFAGIAVVFHFFGDWIAAWGLWPLWPFSNWNAGLGRVNSIDPILLAMTMAAWTIQQVTLMRGRRRLAWAVAIVWATAFLTYVWLRPHYGLPAYV